MVPDIGYQVWRAATIEPLPVWRISDVRHLEVHEKERAIRVFFTSRADSMQSRFQHGPGWDSSAIKRGPCGPRVNPTTRTGRGSDSASTLRSKDHVVNMSGLGLSAGSRVSRVPNARAADQPKHLSYRSASVSQTRRTGHNGFIAGLFVRSIEQLDEILDRIADKAETNTVIVRSQPIPRRLPPLPSTEGQPLQAVPRTRRNRQAVRATSTRQHRRKAGRLS